MMIGSSTLSRRTLSATTRFTSFNAFRNAQSLTAAQQLHCCAGTIIGSTNDDDTKYHRRWSSQPQEHHNMSSVPSLVSLGVISHNDTGFSNIRPPLLRLSLSSHSQKNQRRHQEQHRTFFSFGGGKKADDPLPSNTTNTDSGESAATTTTSTSNDIVVDTTTMTTTTTTASVDETLNKLFEEQDATSGMTSSDAWYSTVEQSAAGAVWDPVWYNVADNAILTINAVQHYSELPYGMSIIVTTILLRVGLFPLMIQAQRSASRMAYVQPELNVMKERYDRISVPTRADQMAFSTNMKALFSKYKVNPLHTVITPAVQLPLFIGMFFGLKKVSQYFPEEVKAGGMLWFPDLSVPDPLYVLPLLSSATFLLLVELGKEQMLKGGKNSELMLNVFRFMSIMSLPFIVNFEASMLLYWVSNNTLTCAQTALLKSNAVRKRFGILDPPKTTDPEKDGLMGSMTTLMNKVQGKPTTEAEIIQRHNQEMEAQQVSTRLTRAAREREKRKRGITGRRNY